MCGSDRRVRLGARSPGASRERPGVWVARRLRRVIGSNIGKRIFVERLGDIGHQLMRPAAGAIIIELLVDGRARLAGKMRILRGHRNALFP